MRRCVLPLLAGLAAVSPSFAQTAPSSTAPKAAALVDAHGNPLRKAKSGHISNYDEAKVGTYTLPDVLKLQDGTPVTTAEQWTDKRRTELLEIYDSQMYGRIPDKVPEVSFSQEGSTMVENGDVERQVVVAHYGPKGSGVETHIVIYKPAHVTDRLPVVLHLTFLGDPPVPFNLGGKAPQKKKGPPFHELGPIKEILAHGYAYADMRYTEAQPDGKDTFESGIAKLCGTGAGGARRGDEWGTIGIWSWVASRAVDYFLTDPQLDGTRVAIVGHSRLGKTVLWAGAQDPRFKVVYSSCAGEMGSSLARRDFGETIDDIAVSFPWQFAENLQQYVGHWGNLPVDTHCLIALSAPRPVFITGGTGDLWADPHGEFLAEVAAGPVYRLLGKQGLSSEEMPAPDHAVMDGDLAFRFHTGPHAIMPEDWTAFLGFADRYLK